jgi:hypothetical protein
VKFHHGSSFFAWRGEKRSYGAVATFLSGMGRGKNNFFCLGQNVLGGCSFYFGEAKVLLGMTLLLAIMRYRAEI